MSTRKAQPPEPAGTVEDSAESAAELHAIAEQSARTCLEHLPAVALERLALLVTPARIRARRTAERNDAVRALAAFYMLPSGRQIGRHMRDDLLRLTTRRARAYSVDHLIALRRVLDLTDGRPPSLSILRGVLAGLDGGQNFGADSGRNPGDTTPRPGARIATRYKRGTMSPTQRTLKHLRELGYPLVQVVERWNPHAASIRRFDGERC